MTDSWTENSRREMMKAGALAAVRSTIGPTLLSVGTKTQKPTKDSIEQWGIFEASYVGRQMVVRSPIRSLAQPLCKVQSRLRYLAIRVVRV